jgi:transcriptional regulator with XRE-family HTH domain
MTKLKTVKEPHQEVCPYCKGTGKVAPSPAVRLRALRDNNNLSQADIANMVGVSLAQIANLESGRGNFSIDLLMRIADRFQISVDWILGRSSDD